MYTSLMRSCCKGEVKTKKLNSSSGESFWSNFKRTFYSGKESNYIGTLDYESKKVVADAEKASAFQAEWMNE